MSKKKNYNQERNPLQMVLYTGIVLALLVFLFVLVLQNKNKQAAFEEKAKEMTARETEMVMTERKPREETESETETVTAGSTNVTVQMEQTRDTTGETEQSGAMSANILVLNGSERPGVAGIWKTHLEESGYTNVYTATYTEALEQTLIYTDNAALGEALETEFTNAVVHPGKVQSGIEVNQGELLPEAIDAYIIIGKNNVIVP